MAIKRDPIWVHIIGPILSFYFIGAAICEIYFNYQYARDHGFWAWLFFGELIATGKALLWPLFIGR